MKERRRQNSTYSIAVLRCLDESKTPMSKAQIARRLGIDLSIPPGKNHDHNNLIHAIDTLLCNKEIVCAYYPGNPPGMSDLAIVGPGTYGYYPKSREVEFLRKKLVTTRETIGINFRKKILTFKDFEVLD